MVKMANLQNFDATQGHGIEHDIIIDRDFRGPDQAIQRNRNSETKRDDDSGRGSTQH